MIQQVEFSLREKRRGFHLVTGEILQYLPQPLPETGLLNLLCNPKFQTRFLNEAQVDLYISVGLGVRRNTNFNANCNGPVTTLVVKDRLLSHNPLGAIYSRYWKKKLGIMDEGQI